MSVLLARRGIMAKQTVSGGGGSDIPTTGLYAWYKADAGTDTTTDGVGVGQWDDQSGNSRHLLQATGTKRPLYKTGIVNSKPVLRFDGTDDWLRATGLTPPGQANPSDLSVFVVAKYNSGTGGMVSTRVLSGGWLFRVASSNTTLFAHIGGSPNATDTVTTTTWNVLELVRSALTPKIGHNGTMTTASAISAYPTATTVLDIGGEDNLGSGPATNLFNGDIAEVIVYSSAVSDADRDSIETYLGTKYAITVV